MWFDLHLSNGHLPCAAIIFILVITLILGVIIFFLEREYLYYFIFIVKFLFFTVKFTLTDSVSDSVSSSAKWREQFVIIRAVRTDE